VIECELADKLTFKERLFPPSQRGSLAKLRSSECNLSKLLDSAERLDTGWHNYYFVVIMEEQQGLGELEQVVLLAILRLKDSAYGVSIRQEIESCTARAVTPGALYTTLERLERKELVSARSGDPTPQRGGRAKRFYLVTSAGRDRLRHAQVGFRSLLKGLNLLGENYG
jgi:PadR family transcriptional regulator, regulatory protein PadR